MPWVTKVKTSMAYGRRATLAKGRYITTHVEMPEFSSPVTQLTPQDVCSTCGGHYNYSKAQTQIAEWKLKWLTV